MSDLNRLIRESTRLVLVSSLYVVEEANYVYLAKGTGFTSGKISSHMSKLESGGYVDITKEYVGKGPRTTYKLNETGRHEFELYRESIDGLLNVAE